MIKNLLIGSALLVSLVGCGGGDKGATMSPTPGGMHPATPVSGSPAGMATPPKPMTPSPH